MSEGKKTIPTPAGPATLRRSRRSTLAISVLPDGSLELVAPEEASETDIAARVQKRLRWILRQRAAFREMSVARPPLRHVPGATHRYLGRQYRLKIRTAPETKVALRGGYFDIELPERSEETVKAALDGWLRRQAREQFQRRLARWSEWCLQRGLPEPRLRLLAMPKRWGSAHPDGTICLNPELIRAPSACVDYVIAHEICHLQHPHHGPKFWALLRHLVPNWQTLKARLEALD